MVFICPLGFFGPVVCDRFSIACRRTCPLLHAPLSILSVAVLPVACSVIVSDQPSGCISHPPVHAPDVLSPGVLICLQAGIFLLGFALSTPMTTVCCRLQLPRRVDLSASAPLDLGFLRGPASLFPLYLIFRL